MILQNHGFLTVGGTVDEAAFLYITAEVTAHAQLLAEAAGTPKLIRHEVAAPWGQIAVTGGTASSPTGTRSSSSSPTSSTKDH